MLLSFSVIHNVPYSVWCCYVSLSSINALLCCVSLSSIMSCVATCLLPSIMSCVTMSLCHPLLRPVLLIMSLYHPLRYVLCYAVSLSSIMSCVNMSWKERQYSVTWKRCDTRPDPRPCRTTPGPISSPPPPCPRNSTTIKPSCGGQILIKISSRIQPFRRRCGSAVFWSSFSCDADPDPI